MTVERDGKTLYQVDVTRTREATFWVMANSLEEAREDAEELATDIHSHEMDGDDDVYVSVATGPPEAGTLVWSGGPEGADFWW